MKATLTLGCEQSTHFTRQYSTVITFVITPPYAHFPEVIRNALLIHFFTSIHVWIPQILYI
jgi:hypothetical protein